MFNLTRPTEPGVYDMHLLDGEEIVSITFSNVERDSFNILTNTGRLLIIGITSGGNLAAAVVDTSDIAGQLPN